MALLGTYIDSRTLAALTSGASASFAHGLPAAPDLVFVHENTTTDSTADVKLAWKSDGTNVSIYNHGAVATATLNAAAVYFHTIVR